MNKKKLIRNYQYSDMPEKIPLGLKRGLKKMIKPGAALHGVVYRPARWVGKMSERFATYVKRPGRRVIQSEQIKTSRAYAYMSYKKDKFLESISRKYYYRFEEMMVVIDPFNWAPLTAVALFYTKQSMAVRYTVKGKTAETDVVQITRPQKEHRVPIIGLYPDHNNAVLMELLDGSGKCVKKRTIYVKTAPLPPDLQNVVERAQYKEESAYDMVLITGGIEIRTFAFDRAGDIRYYLRRKTKAYGIFPLSKGRFLYMEKFVDVPSYSVSQACMMYEMDYLGRIYKTYLYDKGFHHCAWEKEPGGNFLIGSSCLEGHDENVIIELDRKTGEIVDSLNLNDVFDETYQDWTDWVHVNAVSYYKEDHSVIVSMRNIHSVAKIDWETKELKWILSNPKMWEGTRMADKVLQPEGEVKWCYQQHAAYQLQENLDKKAGTIALLVYDNHWARRRPVPFYDGDEAYSYLSIYAIDEKNMTVSMNHCTQVPNSRIRSNARLEYNQNRIFNMAGDLVPTVADSKGMVEEYAFDTNELLNRFYIRPGFFTAYAFEPDVNTMEKPLEEDYDYIVGKTCTFAPYEQELPVAGAKRFVPGEGMDEEQEEVSSDDGQDEDIVIEKPKIQVYAHFQEDILFVKARDHSISAVYLLGKKGTYCADMSGTYQTMEIFEKKVYEVPYWLKDLPADTYHIYYQYNGELYDSEESFTIQDLMY